jgi:Flp pilus assembly protein TadB
MLGVVLLLEVLGIIWLRRILKIEV